jgi:hypothetical protein
MTPLAHQHCLHHPEREAIVRCPACRRDYCRECVTEHDGRYLCTACLRIQAVPPAHQKHRIHFPAGAVLALAGLLTAWVVYYSSAQYLILRNSADHSYRVWHAR